MYRNLCILSLMAGLLCACSSRGGAEGDSRQASQAESQPVAAPQAMQSSLAHTDATYRGRNYHTTVMRRADSSLPMVTNEQGEQFVDNRIKLRVECGGHVVLDRDFTKQDFASWVDARFLRYSVLEAIVFNEVTTSGLAFSASVCYPQTDLYIPLRITVSADGRLQIEREELQEAPQDEPAL